MFAISRAASAQSVGFRERPLSGSPNRGPALRPLSPTTAGGSRGYRTGTRVPAIERSLAHKLFDELTPDVRLGEALGAVSLHERAGDFSVTVTPVNF
jgi:hypothetical protein